MEISTRFKIFGAVTGVALAGIASAGVYMLTQGALSGIVVIAAAVVAVVIVGRVLEETIRNSP